MSARGRRSPRSVCKRQPLFVTHMVAGCSTGISNRPTCCWTQAEPSGSPTSGSLSRLIKWHKLPASQGTLRYMPPEQLEGQADERSDIYALGLTLYELVVLDHAFEGESRSELMKAIRDGRLKPIREIEPQIPRTLAEIIMKACATDPEDRFQTADAMTTTLLAYINGSQRRESTGGWLARLFGG